jgi:hypothetical protein
MDRQSFVFNALYYMHCILCIVFYALHSMHYILCIVFFALYPMHWILCNKGCCSPTLKLEVYGRLLNIKIRSSSTQQMEVVFHLPKRVAGWQSELCIQCIVFYALYSMHCILCIVFYALYSMHCIICILFYAFIKLLKGWGPTTLLRCRSVSWPSRRLNLILRLTQPN